MLWPVLAALIALPAAADEISASSRDHLRSLEATAARLEREGSRGRQYQKVMEEIARIRREYQLGASTNQPNNRTKPSWEDFSDAQSRAKAADDARAQAERRAEAEERARTQARQNAENKARAEAEARASREARARTQAAEEARVAQEAKKAAAQQGNSEWEKRKKDFADLVAEELQRRQNYSRFYRTRAHWDYAYKSQMQFAESPVAAGGLGFDFREADNWVKRVLELQPPEEIAALRNRYVKAVEYVRSPAEQGGLGYVRAQARKVALELALQSSEAEIDKWITQSRLKVLSERGGAAKAKDTCRSWFNVFGG